MLLGREVLFIGPGFLHVVSAVSALGFSFLWMLVGAFQVLTV